MPKKKKQPISLESQRYGLFMNDNSFDLEVFYGRNYLETDSIHRIKIYRVNLTKTKTHKLYGQAKPGDKSLFAPVELSIIPNINASDQSYYGDNSGIVREDTGKLVFGIYLQELDEKGIEINRGDYVEYNMSGVKDRYYEIENADNVTDTTEKTLAGYKPYWKRIMATPVKEDVLSLFRNYTKGS